MKLKLISISTALSWIAFLLIDFSYLGVIHQAVLDKNGTYGELYGPISYFRPIFLCISLLLTLICLCILFFKSNNFSKKQ